MKSNQQYASDASLLAALTNLRETANGIRFLYQTHFESLSNYILHNNGSFEDAQDIFQEVVVAFVHLVQQGKFRGESSVKTFLFSMNRNLWLNELKRRGRALKREKHFEEEKNSNNGPMPAQSMEQREALQQLMQAVDQLGESCKTILLLFYFENKSMKEILEETHFENEQVVRNKKYKCLKKLEEWIASNKTLAQQLKSFFHG